MTATLSEVRRMTCRQVQVWVLSVLLILLGE